ncbi:MAG: hypothetical protein Q8R12_04195 [bacterium]|nr:hypothetical protein [bacterium]
MEQQENKKPFYKKWWVIALAVFFGVGLIGSMADKSTNTPTQTATQSEKTTTTSQPSEPVAGKQYVEVMTFSGNGQKKSEPFTITGSRFKIAYDCKGDTSATYCGAFVFKVGSQLPQGVMNSPQAIKDETIIYGSGEYYIDANTMGNFTMTVYDYK